MKHKHINFAVPVVFILTLGIIIYFYFNQTRFIHPEKTFQRQVKIITPQKVETTATSLDRVSEQLANEDLNQSKIALAADERPVSIVTQNLDTDPQDEQFLVYQKSSNQGSALFFAYIDFDTELGLYKKVWETPLIVTKPYTIRLFVKDLLGDRSTCAVIEGLNDGGEQTLSAFRLIPGTQSLVKIAELKIDGSISINEGDRGQAYQLGLASGTAATLSTVTRDPESANLLDQIEIKYAYNAQTHSYERVGTARIPGSYIEQRQLKELFDGTGEKFEKFLHGLWFYTGSQGQTKQFIYFDTIKREIIFFEDNIQQIYRWQTSTPTRYGIYISSQNISVSTLRRILDVSLESRNSVIIRMFEDVRLKIGITGLWDGSYQKVSSQSQDLAAAPTNQTYPSWIEARYEGSTGTWQFNADGTFSRVQGTVSATGNYFFYVQQGVKLLELRIQNQTSQQREVYMVKQTIKPAGTTPQQLMELTKVRLTVNGIEPLNEGVLQLQLLR
ncbi:MAG: pallilysin-related adhesin [Termitinemataceae bacterium]